MKFGVDEFSMLFCFERWIKVCKKMYGCAIYRGESLVPTASGLVQRPCAKNNFLMPMVRLPLNRVVGSIWDSDTHGSVAAMVMVRFPWAMVRCWGTLLLLLCIEWKNTVLVAADSILFHFLTTSDHTCSC